MNMGTRPKFCQHEILIMNLLQEISAGKTYADFLPTTAQSPRKTSKMTDRRSPVPPVPQGTAQEAEPTREYDIIDEEAVATTANGAPTAPCGGTARKILGQVGHSLNTGADKIFRKGAFAGEFEDAGDGSQDVPRPSERGRDCMPGGLSTNPGEGSEEKHFDQRHSHGNEMEFGTMMQEPGANVPVLNLPHVNCPEKIIICIDLAVEVNRVPFITSEGAKHLPLDLIKKALNMFVQIKSAVNPKHEFALVVLQEKALWIQDFTGDVDDFVNVLLDMTNDTTECESCDLTSLFDVIHDKVQVPDIEDVECVPPPYIIRTLFVYGRSRCIPQLNPRPNGEYHESQKNLSSSPYFFFDVFYVHEPPTEDNFCKEIYDVFLNLDVHNTSYIHEVGRDKAKLQEKMAMLVAHPLQRPPQTQCDYNIFRDE